MRRRIFLHFYEYLRRPLLQYESWVARLRCRGGNVNVESFEMVVLRRCETLLPNAVLNDQRLMAWCGMWTIFQLLRSAKWFNLQ